MRMRRQRMTEDYRLVIQRENEKPFDARIVEVVYYEQEKGAETLPATEHVAAIELDGSIEWTAEACVFDNDGKLVPASQIDGVVAVMDPGEKLLDVLQPKKQRRRRRLMRFARFATGVVKAVT